MNMGFPDVCNTIVGPATVPIPYPNIGMNAQATGFSPFVKISGMNALNQASTIPMTSGDEAGTAHPMIKGPGRYTMGNPIVFIDGMPAIHLGCPTTGNNMNNGLGAVLVPSVTTVTYCDASRAQSSGGGHACRPRELVEEHRLPDGVGLLSLAAFTPAAPALVVAALGRLWSAGATSFVLDLRGNAGGELDAVVRLANELLAAESIIARLIDGDGDEQILRAHGAGPGPWPLVLLVDGRTASAAELFAGALQCHGRALVVGERTYGKGLALAVVVSRATHEARYRAWAEARLPSGEPVQGRGVVPDLEIHEPEQALERAREAAVAARACAGEREELVP